MTQKQTDEEVSMANQESALNGARPNSIKDALRTLDEAIQNDGASLKELVSDDYEHLRNAIGGLAPRTVDAVRRYGSEAMGQASEFATQGMQAGRRVVTDVDARVRANPWPTIAGVAAGSLALGFMLGRSGRD